jgi:hypothetical protein
MILVDFQVVEGGILAFGRETLDANLVAGAQRDAVDHPAS